MSWYPSGVVNPVFPSVEPPVPAILEPSVPLAPAVPLPPPPPEPADAPSPIPPPPPPAPFAAVNAEPSPVEELP